MARWIKITEDSGATLVLDLEKVVAIAHEPNQNTIKDKYVVYLPSGQIILTRLEYPEGYQIIADYMKVLEALSD